LPTDTAKVSADRSVAHFTAPDPFVSSGIPFTHFAPPHIKTGLSSMLKRKGDKEADAKKKIPETAEEKVSSKVKTSKKKKRGKYVNILIIMT